MKKIDTNEVSTIRHLTPDQSSRSCSDLHNLTLSSRIESNKTLKDKDVFYEPTNTDYIVNGQRSNLTKPNINYPNPNLKSSESKNDSDKKYDRYMSPNSTNNRLNDIKNRIDS